MEDSKPLIVKAIGDIADGRTTAAQRARELRQELNRQPMRPGVLSEALTMAEEYYRGMGRLRPDERLTDDLVVKVKGANGRESTVSISKMSQVRHLRGRIDGQGGLIMSGRPLQDDTLLFDLWARDGLGCTSTANPPYVQVTVQNVGG